MNRRHFMLLSALSGVMLSWTRFLKAAPSSAVPSEDLCLLKTDTVTAEATYFARYEHFHTLAIPLSVLINPPASGFTTRTSPLDPESLDEKAFTDFVKETGIDGPSLRKHSHEVKFTHDELERIASGEKEVKITVLTPKGNLGHHFFFTASRSAQIKIQRAREAKS